MYVNICGIAACVTLISIDWPYCNAAQRFTSAIMTSPSLDQWGELKFRRRLEAFGMDDGPGMSRLSFSMKLESGLTARSYCYWTRRGVRWRMVRFSATGTYIPYLIM